MFLVKIQAATLGKNSVEIDAPISRKPQFLYAVNIFNITGPDRIDCYLRPSRQATDSVSLIGQTDTSSAGPNDNDEINWSGKIPFDYPMTIVAEFLDSAANDELHLRMLVGE